MCTGRHFRPSFDTEFGFYMEKWETLSKNVVWGKVACGVGFFAIFLLWGTSCAVSPYPSLLGTGEKRELGKQSYEETRPALRQNLPTSQNRRLNSRHGQPILWLRFMTRWAPSVWLPVSYLGFFPKLSCSSPLRREKRVIRKIGYKPKGSRSVGPDGSQIASKSSRSLTEILPAILRVGRIRSSRRPWAYIRSF